MAKPSSSAPVGGGGRYDGLVSRFRPEPVPATGFSIGVSRLAHALKLTGNVAAAEMPGPVVVLVMDKAETARYQEMVSRLRKAGIRAEMFLGATKNFGKQLAYADKRNSPAVIIEGSDERARSVLQIKDLAVGKAARCDHHRQCRLEGRAPRAVRVRQRPTGGRSSRWRCPPSAPGWTAKSDHRRRAPGRPRPPRHDR